MFNCYWFSSLASGPPSSIMLSFLSGMNLARPSSLAGLLPPFASWEVPYFHAPVLGKQPLTQHHGLIPSQHLLVGKTTCDRGEGKRSCRNKYKMDIETNIDIEALNYWLWLCEPWNKERKHIFTSQWLWGAWLCLTIFPESRKEAFCIWTAASHWVIPLKWGRVLL